jgi:hypothetical protein
MGATLGYATDPMNVVPPTDNSLSLCHTTSRCQQEETDDSSSKRLIGLARKAPIEDMKDPISERKLRANRANAKRSTGPKTEAGKATSRRNALKHGILSRSVDLPLAIPGIDLASLRLNRSLVSEAFGTDSALLEINRIWDKLTKVAVFENNCAHHPDGLEQTGRLICRYERMLTRQLHARIRECAGL